jgi:hypothetical protein
VVEVRTIQPVCFLIVPIWPEDSRLIEGKLPNFDSNLRRESIELGESGYRYSVFDWMIRVSVADVESDL